MSQSRIELFQLRCFVAVAEELNFRRAAERLHMTQPPLSRKIMMLEHAMGLTLLERNQRSVRLTPAGESLLASASDILQRTEHAVLTAQQAERGEAGSLTLAFVPYAGTVYVPLVFKALREALPDVTLYPIEMMSYEIAEGLVSGQIDLAITRSQSPLPEIKGIQVVDEPFILAAPADHPLATAPEPKLEDLDGLPFVGYSRDRGAFLRQLHNGLFATAGIKPDPVVELSQTSTVLAMVNLGVGVALVPAASRTIRMDNIVYRDIPIPSNFRSRLYLNSGPKRLGLRQDKVTKIICTTLSRHQGQYPLPA